MNIAYKTEKCVLFAAEAENRRKIEQCLLEMTSSDQMALNASSGHVHLGVSHPILTLIARALKNIEVEGGITCETKKTLRVILQMKHVCLWTSHHSKIMSGLCGRIEILGKVRQGVKQYYHTSLLGAHMLNMMMIQFKMMSSRYCEINVLMVWRHVRCGHISHYCGHLPPWNESSPTSSFSLLIMVTWPLDDINILLQYDISKKHALNIYTQKYLKHGQCIYISPPLHDGMVTFLYSTHAYIKIRTNYSCLIYLNKWMFKVHNIQDQVPQSQLVDIFDGPGLWSNSMNGHTSSSFQVYVHIHQSHYQTYLDIPVQFSSIQFPRIAETEVFHYLSNKSYYHVIQSLLYLPQNT